MERNWVVVGGNGNKIDFESPLLKIVGGILRVVVDATSESKVAVERLRTLGYRVLV